MQLSTHCPILPRRSSRANKKSILHQAGRQRRKLQEDYHPKLYNQNRHHPLNTEPEPTGSTPQERLRQRPTEQPLCRKSTKALPGTSLPIKMSPATTLKWYQSTTGSPESESQPSQQPPLKLIRPRMQPRHHQGKSSTDRPHREGQPHQSTGYHQRQPTRWKVRRPNQPTTSSQLPLHKFKSLQPKRSQPRPQKRKENQGQRRVFQLRSTTTGSS